MRLDRDAVRKVIGLLKGSSAEELAIQDGDTYVRARRQPIGDTAPAGAAPDEKGTGADSQSSAAAIGASAEAPLHVVKAGLVGLFHRGKGPDSEALVEVGARVTEGQVIGTIEALRKLTDVVCDVDGELVEVLQEDGEPIEYGQPVFAIRAEGGNGS